MRRVILSLLLVAMGLAAPAAPTLDPPGVAVDASALADGGDYDTGGG